MTIRRTWLSSLLLVYGAASGSRAAQVAVVIGPVPRLVIVVGTPVQYCESCDDDVFFYGGLWYAYRFGVWYRCGSWGAPWVLVDRGRLPRMFLRVPPGRFRHRWGPYHPAHDHHPELDTWKRDAVRERRDDRTRIEPAGPAGGSEAERGKPPARKNKKGKGGKHAGGQGHGRE